MSRPIPFTGGSLDLLLRSISSEMQFSSRMSSNAFRLGAVIDGRLVAIAQYARQPHASIADMAILVADAWQQQDLGARLVTALSLLAQASGVHQFAVSLQLDNPGALRLIRRLAPLTRLVLVGGGVAEADISLVDIKQSTRPSAESPWLS